MPFELSLEEGESLVKLARKAIERFLKTGKKLTVPKNIPTKLMQKCGVFVTLNYVEDGAKKLRGCIGYPEPILPLIEATIDSAINAAVHDPRFPTITLKELDRIVVEVSVLTPPQLIEAKDPKDYPHNITIGKDGLIVERGLYKGLLLPQVPIEWNWDAEEFLCNCCMKAGLPPDHWVVEGTKIYSFQAIIFEEESPKGKVSLKSLGDSVGDSEKDYGRET